MVQNTTEETGSVVKGGNATAGVNLQKAQLYKKNGFTNGQIPVITQLSKIGVPVHILLCTIMTVKVIMSVKMSVMPKKSKVGLHQLRGIKMKQNATFYAKDVEARGRRKLDKEKILI